jgi:hypothetical protein
MTVFASLILGILSFSVTVHFSRAQNTLLYTQLSSPSFELMRSVGSGKCLIGFYWFYLVLHYTIKGLSQLDLYSLLVMKLYGCTSWYQGAFVSLNQCGECWFSLPA